MNLGKRELGKFACNNVWREHQANLGRAYQGDLYRFSPSPQEVTKVESEGERSLSVVKSDIIFNLLPSPTNGGKIRCQ